jgi:hypothetical protein
MGLCAGAVIVFMLLVIAVPLFSIATIVGEPILNDRILFAGGELVSREYDLSIYPKGLYLINLKNDEFSRVVKYINR